MPAELAGGIVAAHHGLLGRWGQAALAASFAGSVGGAAVMGLESTAFPILATETPELLDLNGPLLTAPGMIGVVILLLGWPIGLTILGIAAARARIFPRSACILLAIGAPAFIALEGPFLPVLGVLSALLFGGPSLVGLAPLVIGRRSRRWPGP